MFVVTQEILEDAFIKFNEMFFDAALEVDELEVDELDTEWGFCVDDDDEWVLGVTNVFPSEQAFHETLLHELTHLYQINAGLEVNHDEKFQEICEGFQKYGFNVE
jgi:hypothetical protein